MVLVSQFKDPRVTDFRVCLKWMLSVQAYPFEIDWSVAYHDASLPLVVDIGSGTYHVSLNKLFLL